MLGLLYSIIWFIYDERWSKTDVSFAFFVAKTTILSHSSEAQQKVRSTTNTFLRPMPSHRDCDRPIKTYLRTSHETIASCYGEVIFGEYIQLLFLWFTVLQYYILLKLNVKISIFYSLEQYFVKIWQRWLILNLISQKYLFIYDYFSMFSTCQQFLSISTPKTLWLSEYKPANKPW